MAEIANSIRGKWANSLYRQSLNESLGKSNSAFAPLPHFQGPPKSIAPTDEKLPEGKAVIIGAGVSGLYLAMALDMLGIDYEILEATDRAGGRILTHYFPEDPSCKHNYYDIGAMRFPKIPSMYPTTRLFEELKIHLEDYILDNDNLWSFYNQENMTSQKIAEAMKPLDDAFRYFVKLLEDNFENGFKVLLKCDNFSTRDYLMTQLDKDDPDFPGRKRQPNMTYEQVQELETYNTGTSLFSQSFTESILDYLDFDSSDTKWYRVEGGTQKLIDAMLATIKTQPTLNSRVVSILHDYQSVKDEAMVVKTSDGKIRKYNCVFNTTTLGCLQRIDMNGMPLRDGDVGSAQWTAIRSLHYDSSTKVAIKFKTAWWRTKCGIKKLGGVTSTDLPIRVLVLPSWNDDVDKPTVAICSYTWSQDATRMGSLVSRNSPKEDDEQLVEVIFQNLAAIYREQGVTMDFLRDQYICHHGYAWGQNPRTADAFALFGPGQFSRLYPAIRRPISGSNNKMYLVGEHASTHHAWICGALYSAAEALHMYLHSQKLYSRLKKLEDSWIGESCGPFDNDGNHEAAGLEKAKFGQGFQPGTGADPQVGLQPSNLGQGFQGLNIGQGLQPSTLGQGVQPGKLGQAFQGLQPGKLGQGIKRSDLGQGISAFFPR